MIYFISGHRKINKDEFDRLYIPAITKVIAFDPDFRFVVAECRGVDSMAQDLLKSLLSEDQHYRVTVYHMFDKPRYLASDKFNVRGGFKDDIERDTAMTIVSNFDIAFVRKGCWESGTAQNIQRRHEFE